MQPGNQLQLGTPVYWISRVRLSTKLTARTGFDRLYSPSLARDNTRFCTSPDDVFARGSHQEAQAFMLVFMQF